MKSLYCDSNGNYSVHVQSICDSLDIPHFETHPVLKSQIYTDEETQLQDDNEVEALQRATQTYDSKHDEIAMKEKLSLTFEGAKTVNKNIFQNKRSVYSIYAPKYTFKAHLSLNVHPRVEDLNVAYRDFIIRANWTKVALVYSGKSGPSIFHLQHLLLLKNVNCITKKN